jgi:hypothetical protein
MWQDDALIIEGRSPSTGARHQRRRRGPSRGSSWRGGQRSVAPYATVTPASTWGTSTPCRHDVSDDESDSMADWGLPNGRLPSAMGYNGVSAWLDGTREKTETRNASAGTILDI